MTEQHKPEYIIIGRIAGAFGVKGELKLEILTDHPERFKTLKRIYLGAGEDGSKNRYATTVLSGRLHSVKHQALLRLEGITTPEEGDKLRGLWVQVPVDEAWPLEEGSYYEFQLLGLAVRTTDQRELGTVRQILYLGSNDVYVVKGDSPTAKEYLIPAIKDVVKEINIEAGYILIEPMAGLLGDLDKGAKLTPRTRGVFCCHHLLSSIVTIVISFTQNTEVTCYNQQRLG